MCLPTHHLSQRAERPNLARNFKVCRRGGRLIIDCMTSFGEDPEGVEVALAGREVELFVLKAEEPEPWR